MQAENTYPVLDWLWSSGQLSVHDIQQLPALGIQHLINLAPPTSSNALQGEAEFISKLGINYFQLPVTWDNPELEKLQTFIHLLASLQGQQTWVHCAKNMRVSAFIYLFRKLYLGEAEEIAMQPMRNIWQPNAVWAQFIVAAKLAARDGTLKLPAT
jgi:protein tyrosine phosphatase (PTP) superfamily phosphohydrolase (DUF442 family)